MEVITINFATDARVTGCSLPCTLYVGVTGFLRPSAYTLLAYSTMTSLLDGSPQQGHAPASSMVYFAYRASSVACDLSFLVTQLQGSVAVFINAGVTGNTSLPALPVPTCTSLNSCTVSNWLWTSLSSFDLSTVNIRAGSTGFCTSCYYVIGVLSTTAGGSDFSLVAASCNTSIVLADGVPHSDYVVRGGYQYYRMIISESVDVEITLTPNFGDPDLYISWDPSNPHPNRTNFDMQATSQYNDTIYIQVCVFQGVLLVLL